MTDLFASIQPGTLVAFALAEVPTPSTLQIARKTYLHARVLEAAWLLYDHAAALRYVGSRGSVAEAMMQACIDPSVYVQEAEKFTCGSSWPIRTQCSCGSGRESFILRMDEQRPLATCLFFSRGHSCRSVKEGASMTTPWDSNERHGASVTAPCHGTLQHGEVKD